MSQHKDSDPSEGSAERDRFVQLALVTRGQTPCKKGIILLLSLQKALCAPARPLWDRAECWWMTWKGNIDSEEMSFFLLDIVSRRV